MTFVCLVTAKAPSQSDIILYILQIRITYPHPDQVDVRQRIVAEQDNYELKAVAEK